MPLLSKLWELVLAPGFVSRALKKIQRNNLLGTLVRNFVLIMGGQTFSLRQKINGFFKLKYVKLLGQERQAPSL